MIDNLPALTIVPASVAWTRPARVQGRETLHRFYHEDGFSIAMLEKTLLDTDLSPKGFPVRDGLELSGLIFLLLREMS